MFYCHSASCLAPGTSSSFVGPSLGKALDRRICILAYNFSGGSSHKRLIESFPDTYPSKFWLEVRLNIMRCALLIYKIHA
jgi:hypothetical protein